MDIIWENRGIALGIMSYLLKRHETMKDRRIVIGNDKMRRAMRVLFGDLSFAKFGRGFKVNIKNDRRAGLVINNLNNLSRINASRAVVLPWYDPDNPMVMFRHRKNKRYDIDALRNSARRFSQRERFANYGPPNYFEQKYSLPIWDGRAEYAILSEYASRYSANLDLVYQFMDREFGGPRSGRTEYRAVPVPQPVPVAGENGLAQRKEPVRGSIRAEKREHDGTAELVRNIADKIAIINKLIETK